tara:strand:- start:214 stop:834 length:621 start_codon:yes stop_codon:yes gene_type:complete
MTAHHPLPNNDLKNLYGYSDRRLTNLDALANKWLSKTEQGWGRLIEAKVDMREVMKPPKPSPGMSMNEEEVTYFSEGVRQGFRTLAARHGMTPIQAWEVVEDGLRKIGMHHDDLEDAQQFVFGWVELTPNEMCRWALRYPKRCPILDVLCSLDHTCQRLNETQDWLLNKKGSYGRTCNDVLPALPDPDGIRPNTPIPTNIPCHPIK